MAIGNKLKGLFIQEPELPVTPGVVPTAPKPEVVNVKPLTEDSKIADALTLALKERALPEYDFMKFMDSQRALSVAIPDESTRYKATFATVKGTGITKSKLLETAKYYVSILDSEKATFMSGVEGQFKDKVGSNQKRIADIETLIGAKGAEIKKLREELATASNNRDTLVVQVTDWQTKIEAAKFSFEQVYARLRTQIENDVGKITNHLD